MLLRIFKDSPALSWVGLGFLVLSGLILVYLPYNPHEVLGINSMIKPLKFSLSIWIYFWTMAYVVPFLEDQKIVRNFTVLAIITMLYEQTVITARAYRGELSHFNESSALAGMQYALMGILIVAITLYTLYLAVKFRKQPHQRSSPAQTESIYLGLLVFVVGSLLGGVMSGVNSHYVGGELDKARLPFVNWSVEYGDLRVAHFFGIHSLQIIIVVGFAASQFFREKKAVNFVRLFSLVYGLFILFTLIQALLGMPLIESNHIISLLSRNFIAP